MNLVQWHLTAATTEPAGETYFVTVLQPYRAADGPPEPPSRQDIPGGQLVTVPTENGDTEVAIRSGGDPVRWRGDTFEGAMTAWRIEGGDVIRHCVIRAD